MLVNASDDTVSGLGIPRPCLLLQECSVLGLNKAAMGIYTFGNFRTWNICPHCHYERQCGNLISWIEYTFSKIIYISHSLKRHKFKKYYNNKTMFKS